MFSYTCPDYFGKLTQQPQNLKNIKEQNSHDNGVSYSPCRWCFCLPCICLHTTCPAHAGTHSDGVMLFLEHQQRQN